VKRLAATLAAFGLLALGTAGSALGDASSPPSCFGNQDVAPAAQSSPGALGAFISGYAHFFNSTGTSIGQTGIPFAKATCPAPIPPPPS
jgi:hypothetical protein